MAPTIPAGEPLVLAAGTTWEWTQSWSDFPVGDGWAVTYYATGATSFSITTAVSGSVFLASKSATNSAAITAGVYAWQAIATLSSAKYVAGEGTWTVEKSTQVTAASDQRTHDQKMLASIESELEARITGTGSAHESYGNGDQSITKLSTAELTRMRGLYAWKVQIAQNGGITPGYEVTFVRP